MKTFALCVAAVVTAALAALAATDAVRIPDGAGDAVGVEPTCQGCGVPTVAVAVEPTCVGCGVPT